MDAMTERDGGREGGGERAREQGEKIRIGRRGGALEIRKNKAERTRWMFIDSRQIAAAKTRTGGAAGAALYQEERDAYFL